MHLTVCEGYQILLRAEAELFLPIDRPRMQVFYQKIADACMNWATDIHGEMLRKEFLSLDEIREKSRFRTQRYRLRMRIPWEEGPYASILCESDLIGQWHQPQKSYHRISHVWNTEEESVLPFTQILQDFGLRITKNMLPFRPDGIYPEAAEVVFFRNATESSPFLEKRLPRLPGKGQP